MVCMLFMDKINYVSDRFLGSTVPNLYCFLVTNKLPHPFLNDVMNIYRIFGKYLCGIVFRKYAISYYISVNLEDLLYYIKPF